MCKPKLSKYYVIYYKSNIYVFAEVDIKKSRIKGYKRKENNVYYCLINVNLREFQKKIIIHKLLKNKKKEVLI